MALGSQRCIPSPLKLLSESSNAFKRLDYRPLSPSPADPTRPLSYPFAPYCVDRLFPLFKILNRKFQAVNRSSS